MGKRIYISVLMTLVYVCLLTVPPAYAGGRNGAGFSKPIVVPGNIPSNTKSVTIPTTISTTYVNKSPNSVRGNLVFKENVAGYPVYDFAEVVLLKMPADYNKQISGLDFEDGPVLTKVSSDDLLARVVLEEK